MTKLGTLEPLRIKMKESGAQGTGASLLNAFGLHFNVEVPSLEVFVLQVHLRVFVLLYPWIKERVRVDISRKVSPFINPFSDEDVSHLLSERYPVDRKTFIDDYLLYNPTRNRPLDLLPIMGLLELEAVKNRASSCTSLFALQSDAHHFGKGAITM